MSIRVCANRFEKSNRLRSGNFPGVHSAKITACMSRTQSTKCIKRAVIEWHWRNKRTLTGADDWPTTRWPRYLRWYWLAIKSVQPQPSSASASYPSPSSPFLFRPSSVPRLSSDVCIIRSCISRTYPTSPVVSSLDHLPASRCPFSFLCATKLDLWLYFPPLRTTSISKLLPESTAPYYDEIMESGQGFFSHRKRNVIEKS